MKTENLSKIALTEDLLNNCEAIERELGIEISTVYNYNAPVELLRHVITPGCNMGLFFKNRWPFTRENELVSWDSDNGVMIIRGRDKYKRSYSCAVFQFQKVGYKVKTTNKPAGWIWANPVKID